MTTIDETLGSGGITIEADQHAGPARRVAPILRVKQGMDIVTLEPVQARALASLLHRFASEHDE